MTRALPTGVIIADMTVISAIINRARNEQARNEQIVMKLLFDSVKIFAAHPTNIIALKIKYALGRQQKITNWTIRIQNQMTNFKDYNFQRLQISKITNFKDYKFQRLQISKTTNFKDYNFQRLQLSKTTNFKNYKFQKLQISTTTNFRHKSQITLLQNVAK